MAPRNKRLEHSAEEILLIGLREAHELEKQKSKDAGLRFDLTVGEFRDLCFSPCHFCKSKGTTPVTSQHKRNQIDRLDRLKHFTFENSIATCRLCYKARRLAQPSMVWRIIRVNRVLGLIDEKNNPTKS